MEETEAEATPTPAATADSFAMRKLALLEQKCATIRAIKDAGGGEEEIAVAEQTYKDGLRAVKKQERRVGAKPPTAKRQRLIDLNLKEKTYQHVFKVDEGQAKAKEYLRAMVGAQHFKFFTPPFGQRNAGAALLRNMML